MEDFAADRIILKFDMERKHQGNGCNGGIAGHVPLRLYRADREKLLYQ